MNHEATVGVPVGSSGHPGRAVSAIGIDNRDGLGFFHPGGLRPGDRHVQRGGRKPGGNGAFAYNPAAMGFHDRTSVSLGPSSSGQASVSTRLRDTMTAPVPTGSPLPLFQATLRVHNQWRIGLGIGDSLGSRDLSQAERGGAGYSGPRRRPATTLRRPPDEQQIGSCCLGPDTGLQGERGFQRGGRSGLLQGDLCTRSPKLLEFEIRLTPKNYALGDQKLACKNLQQRRSVDPMRIEHDALQEAG